MLIHLFTSKCAFYVGDSTAKVVNSEQITTLLYIHILMFRNFLIFYRFNNIFVLYHTAA